ncbi:MAG: hypothetical protein BWK80_19380 [Desulfobacteraceae bacterium IS3]|nr:MAG: hypothetical protein BWK80_19380 [Desulfobacteraceae bacterium IS3]
MPLLHADDLNTEDFVEMIRKASFPEKSLLMTFSPAQAYFLPFRFNESYLIGTDQGRIFSPQGELKWRRVGDKMRVVYLGDKPPDGLEDYSTKMSDLKSEQSCFILWRIGIAKKAAWIYKEFPDGQVAIVVEKWLDLYGSARFSRYHSLKAIKEKCNAAG